MAECAGNFSVFITRCLTDFPDHDFYKHVLQVYDANTTNTEVLLGRLRLLEKSVIEENDDPAVLIGIIDNEYEFWKGLFFRMTAAIGQRNWPY